MKPERAIQRAGIRALEKLGCVCIKMGNASRRGIPDVLVLLPWGSYCFIEFKTETGKLLPIQDHRFEELRRKTCTRVFICRSTDDAVNLYRSFVRAIEKKNAAE